MYKADVIADSTNEYGHRLTTFKVTYPRIVHAEMCRHRMLSRNTASSRAIPFKKMVKDVEENPFIPIAWQKAHSGMQGSEYLEIKKNIYGPENYWRDARNLAVSIAKSLDAEGVTKQLCNRLLEPFVWVTEIISGTEWENFFELRCPKYELLPQGEDEEITYCRSKKDYVGNLTYLPSKETDWFLINKSQADIHIQAIAELMWDKFNSSTPKHLSSGEWHIPDLGHKWDVEKLAFTTKSGDTFEETNKLLELSKIKIATAHCAKISYDNFGTKVDYEADIKLHDRLADMKHWSPFEHIAKAMSEDEMDENLVVENGKATLGKSHNFTGFIQYRTIVENEFRTVV